MLASSTTSVSTDVPTLNARASSAPIAGSAASRREQVRTRDVADVHVVARLLAVAEDRQRRPVEDAVAEDRDDARFAVRVLSRPVHVAEYRSATASSPCTRA